MKKLLLGAILLFSTLGFGQNFTFKNVSIDETHYIFKNGKLSINDDTLTWTAGKDGVDNPVNNYEISGSYEDVNGVVKTKYFYLEKIPSIRDKKMKGVFKFDGKKYWLIIYTIDGFTNQTVTMSFMLNKT